jgi:hypothetical protein
MLTRVLDSTHEKSESLLFFWVDLLNLHQVIHHHMITTILMQEQNDVVFQGSEGECAQQVNSCLGADIFVVQDSSDKHEEEIAQSPTAVAEQQVLMKFF